MNANVQFCVRKSSTEGFNYFHKCDRVLKDLIYLLIRMFLNDGNLLTSSVIGWLSQWRFRSRTLYFNLEWMYGSSQSDPLVLNTDPTVKETEMFSSEYLKSLCWSHQECEWKIRSLKGNEIFFSKVWKSKINFQDFLCAFKYTYCKECRREQIIWSHFIFIKKLGKIWLN